MPSVAWAQIVDPIWWWNTTATSSPATSTCPPEWKLGNVCGDEFDTVLKSSLFREFGGRKHQWNAQCSTCGYLSLCAGCCPKNRPGRDPANLSALCAGWKIFFQHTLERFKRLAADVVEDRKAAIRQRRFGVVPQRNSPCPCGSGRKYKKCCGA